MLAPDMEHRLGLGTMLALGPPLYRACRPPCQAPIPIRGLIPVTVGLLLVLQPPGLLGAARASMARLLPRLT